MSAYADQTLHRKIYNINDTDLFFLYLFFKNVAFAHSFLGYEFMCEFEKEFFKNFVHKFMYKIHMNLCKFICIFARKICYVTNGLYWTFWCISCQYATTDKTLF